MCLEHGHSKIDQPIGDLVDLVVSRGDDRKLIGYAIFSSEMLCEVSNSCYHEPIEYCFDLSVWYEIAKELMKYEIILYLMRAQNQ